MRVSKPATQEVAEPNKSWRLSENLGLPKAAGVAGVSVASLYRAESEGKLTFVRLAGRTLVTTESLAQWLAGAEAWSKSERGEAARASRRAPPRAALKLAVDRAEGGRQ